MAVTISHRNQNITGPHASGRPSPVVGGMVRIDGKGWLGKYQEGLFYLCRKDFGFIANLRQARYKSNAKTTPQRATVAKPRTPTYLVGAPPKSVRPEPVEGGPPPPATPASPSPVASFLRRQESREAPRGASPSPIASPTPTKGAPPKSVHPEPVEGSPPPPATPASPSPARVIPAKAGIQRGAARGVSVPHRTPTPHQRRASQIRSP